MIICIQISCPLSLKETLFVQLYSSLWKQRIFACSSKEILYFPVWCLDILVLSPNTLLTQSWTLFQSVRLSVCPSVRLSRLPCPLCNIYSSGWILSIFATNDHYYERVCRTQWPLTLTYIFKVIRPWLRISCPLCSVYSYRWIIFIFGTNDHYH